MFQRIDDPNIQSKSNVPFTILGKILPFSEPLMGILELIPAVIGREAGYVLAWLPANHRSPSEGH